MYDKVGDAVLVQYRRFEMFQPFEEESGQDPDVGLRVQTIPSRKLVVQRGSVLIEQKHIGTRPVVSAVRVSSGRGKQDDLGVAVQEGVDHGGRVVLW